MIVDTVKRSESVEYKERLLEEFKKLTGHSIGDLFVYGYLSGDCNDYMDNKDDESKMLWVDIDLPNSCLVFINLNSGEKTFLGGYDFLDDVLHYLKNRTNMYSVWEEFAKYDFNVRQFQYELGGNFTLIEEDKSITDPQALKSDDVSFALDLGVLGLFFLEYKKI